MTFKDFVRGGQICIHQVRMTTQIVVVIALLSCLVFALLGGIYFWLNTSALERNRAFAYALSHWDVEHKKYYKEHQYLLHDGSKRTSYSIDIVRNPLSKLMVSNIKRAGFKACNVAFWGVVIFLLGTILFFILSGRRQREGKHLRGGKLITVDKLSRDIKSREMASDLTLAGVPLIKNSECEHTLFLGSPGVGKTQGIYELLDSIRRRRERAIVYDCEGSFVARYYREGKDKILNPLDARGEPWHVWADAHVSMHFDALAASMMPTPMQQGDPFWLSAARIIFSVVAQRMAGQSHKTSSLLSTLVKADMDELKRLTKGSEAEPFVSENLAKLTTSIQAMVSTHLASWKYLPDTEDAFSIRDWVLAADKENTDDSWIFITTREEYHETLKPLITTWLDIAGNALLSLNERLSRRIWYVVDELPTLNRIRSFEQLLARGRKRGVCCIAGLQNVAQLQESCGNRAPERLANLFATAVLFRANDAQTAQWISKALGRFEVEEARENISYGAHEMRDGVSVSKQAHIKDLVLPEEIMRLPKFHAYLRLAGDYALTQLRFTLKEREVKSEAFIPRDLDDLAMLALKPSYDETETEDKEASLEATSKVSPPVKKSRQKITSLPQVSLEEEI